MSTNKKLSFAFAINWKITLASAVFFPLLISLGMWQLNRAEQKQTILEEWHSQQALGPILVESLEVLEDHVFQSISIQGYFDHQRYWLLENRFFRGVLGYEVIMVFHTVSQEQLLVNRGWVRADVYRATLPKVETPLGELQLRGTLALPADYKFLSATATENDQWPQRVLEIDIEQMSQQHGSGLYKRVLRLQANTSAALDVDWQLVTVFPEKHRAYAFQWFTMAFVLLILWVVANTNIAHVVRAYFESNMKPED